MPKLEYISGGEYHVYDDNERVIAKVQKYGDDYYYRTLDRICWHGWSKSRETAFKLALELHKENQRHGTPQARN